MAKYIDLALDAIKKLENEVDTCNYNASLSIHVANRFLEDSFSEGGEIDYVTYKAQIKKVDDLATKFTKNCICLNKDRIGIELKKVLSKYGYVKI